MQLEVMLATCGVVLVGLCVLLWRVIRVDRRIDRLPGAERIERIERALGEFERLRAIDEGLRRLADAVANAPRALVPADLAPLNERLDQVARAIAELRHYVDDLRSRAAAAGGEPRAGTRLLHALEQRGFEAVRILGELGDDEGEESLRVPVEARRAGMSFKGYVTLAEGHVTEVALKPVTEVFP